MRNGIYQVLEAALDVAALAVSWPAAIVARLTLAGILPGILPARLSREQLIGLAPPLPALLALCALFTIWLRWGRPGWAPLGGRASVAFVETWLVAYALAIVSLFLALGTVTSVSRSFVLLLLPISMAALATARCGARRLAAAWDRRWAVRERVVMIGGPNAALAWVQRLPAACDAHLDLVGIVMPDGATATGSSRAVRVLGTTRQLGELINRERPQRVVIIDSALEHQEAESCARISRRMGVALSHAILDWEAPARIAARPGLPLLDVEPARFRHYQERFKRILDIIGAAGLIVLTAPVMIAAALLVKATSRGPVLYRAPRVGQGGRHFTFYKFRSMYLDAEERGAICYLNEQSGHLFKFRNDPRVTPVGRLLRRYSIDELPQLFNVLAGKMSLVGPRPLPAEDLEADGQSRRFAFWAEVRSSTPPGITGLWQVSGRSSLAFTDMIRLDVDYIRDWSLWLDLRILLRTPAAVLRGSGAY